METQSVLHSACCVDKALTGLVDFLAFAHVVHDEKNYFVDLLSVQFRTHKHSCAQCRDRALPVLRQILLLCHDPTMLVLTFTFMKSSAMSTTLRTYLAES